MEEMFRLQQYEPLWDEWHLDKILHEGSLSNVYQVKNGNTIGVVKVISVPKLQSEGRLSGQGEQENYETMNGFFKEVVGALVDEIERVSVLNHVPNVLGYQKWKVYQRKEDVGYDLILLMDKEESLKEYLKLHDTVDNGEIVRIVKEVAWILDKAHQEGIVHKNIKIENIFIAENGESMLADFSLARKVESYQSGSQRKADPTYKAPEILSEYDYNESTDIYALGMVLYLLLNEQRIPSGLMKRNFKTELPKPCRAGEQLTKIVFRAIAYRSRDRFSSADEFFRALSELREGELQFPEDYISRIEEIKKQKEEQQKREEESRRAEEERQRRVEEERQAEQERRKRAEEERKAEEERQKRVEEERKAEEERQKRAEEERQEEEERQKRAEEERQAEEERLEKERKALEEARRAEEERKRLEDAKRAEEERRQQEEELKERLRKEAEEVRIRAAEEKAAKEREELGKMAQMQECDLCDEATLEGAAAELQKSVEAMKQVEEDAKEAIQKAEVNADGRLVYDRTAEPNKEFTDYSSEYDEKLLDEVFEEVNEMRHTDKLMAQKIEQEEHLSEFDSAELFGQMLEEKDGAPEYKIHSDATEYSGFFDFDQETYKEKEKENEALYDKSLDTEPFEQKMENFPKDPVKKAHLIIVFVILLLCGGLAYGWYNQDIREKVKGWFYDVSEYIEEQMEMGIGCEKIFESND